MASSPEPGELLEMRVTFIEDRAGRAIVRLSNGSKTTLDYDGLRRLGGSVHFVRDRDGTVETAWCQEQDCGWSQEAATRVEAETSYLAHLESEHGDGL